VQRARAVVTKVGEAARAAVTKVGEAAADTD